MTKVTLQVMTRIIVGAELARNQRSLNTINTYFGGNFLCG